MQNTIEALQHIIADFSNRFNHISQTDFSHKPLPHKWSKLEVLGHLIDSAQNNLRRFICAQYETRPPKIFYGPDSWVAINAYQNARKEDIILLWKLLNERICEVLQNMPAAHYTKLCDTSNEGEALHTLAWLAEDYVKHMKHHLNQIIPGAFTVISDDQSILK